MTQENKDEILEAIQNFANQTEKRFDNLEGRFDNLEGRFDNLEGRFDNLEGKVTKIEATMVTKDYLDDKLADLQGDLIVLIRKEDTKLAALVEVLKDRKVIDDNDIRKILSLEPFPKNL